MKKGGSCRVPKPTAPTSIRPGAKLGGGPTKYSNEDRGKPKAVDKSTRTTRPLP